jgi:acyl carrier protein
MIKHEDILAVIEDIGLMVEVSSLDPSLELREQGLDSLDVVNIYFNIEEKYDVKLPEGPEDQLKTINSIIEFINNKKA